MPNQRLYSEAFTGRAKRHPQCPHCLSEGHAGAGYPHNPNPPLVGWFQGTPPPQTGQSSSLPSVVPPQRALEVCRNFNNNRCRFTRCRFLHTCSECTGPHPAWQCPQRQGNPTPRVAATRGRPMAQARLSRLHPYAPSSGPGAEQL